MSGQAWGESGLIGHSSPATTARYAHLAADPLKAVTERTGAAIIAAMSGKPAQVQQGARPRRRR